MGRHMLITGVPLGLITIAISAWIGGTSGLISSAIAVVIVIANLAGSGALIARAAANSAVAAMAMAVVSFFSILIILTVFVVLAHGASWMNLRIFGISMIALHIVIVGLEARKVSGRLAYSGFFPSKKELN